MALENRCSTPFGIIGIFTISQFIYPQTKSFCSTPFGIIGIFTRPKAASSTPGRPAQRLSASLESSRGRAGKRRRRGDLLNAFRHHWNLHAAHFTAYPKPAHAAQRLSASLESSQRPTRWQSSCTSGCSTPFGIIGIFTGATHAVCICRISAQRLSASLESSRLHARERVVEHQLLNAFRHHWNLHAHWINITETGGGCSTPFGIIGIFTPPRTSCSNAGSTAQRLSASLESSQRAVTNREHAHHLLNAFRHHWNLHDKRFHCRRPPITCSTPFGIIGIFTRLETCE